MNLSRQWYWLYAITFLLFQVDAQEETGRQAPICSRSINLTIANAWGYFSVIKSPGMQRSFEMWEWYRKIMLEISSFSHSWSGVVETLDILWDVEQERIWSSDKVYWVDDSKTGLFVFNDYFDFAYWLNGSPPFLIVRFWASTVFFTRTVSAYVNLIDFGLTAKQPLFSTGQSKYLYHNIQDLWEL